MMNEPIKFKLQTFANKILATQYDNSGDFWHYVTVSDNEYAINIWDADEYGDGTMSGLQIHVYPIDAVTGVMNNLGHVLELAPLALKASQLRNKIMEKLK